MYLSLSLYIYIYTHTSLSIYVYIYIYVYTYVHRARGAARQPASQRKAQRTATYVVRQTRGFSKYAKGIVSKCRNTNPQSSLQGLSVSVEMRIRGHLARSFETNIEMPTRSHLCKVRLLNFGRSKSAARTEAALRACALSRASPRQAPGE